MSLATNHTCDAVVVCCIDFRFQQFIRQWTDQHLAGQKFDLIGFAGATKDLNTVMQQIDLSVKLHHIKRVVLIHHQDCGAYGKDSNLANHTKDLLKAKQTILAKYPDLTVDCYYLTLKGEFQPIK